MRYVMVALASVSLSVGAAAQDIPSPAAPTTERLQEKKVCRTIVRTGTIRGKRICWTKGEWAAWNGKGVEQAGNWLDKRQSTLLPPTN